MSQTSRVLPDDSIQSTPPFRVTYDVLNYQSRVYRCIDPRSRSTSSVPRGDVFLERFIHARLPTWARGSKVGQYVVRDSDRRLGLLGRAGRAAAAHELFATVQIRACDPFISDFWRIFRVTRAATRAF